MTVYITNIGCICASADTISDLRDVLINGKGFELAKTSHVLDRQLSYGLVSQVETMLGLTRTQTLIEHCLRQMPLLAQLSEHYDMTRVGVVLGESVSGMRETELAEQSFCNTQTYSADFSIDCLNLNNPARYIANRFQIQGPVLTISNACASGAMAIASAARYLEIGLCDAVICGGVDGFSRFTTEGFLSLGAISEAPCAPFSAARSGINLGEGGALLLLTKDPSPVAVLGWGESSDAHHISAPDPTGEGAAQSMLKALEKACLNPKDVDFVCMHGTATQLNDAMEAAAVNRVFGPDTPCASMKHLSGHTLAGAGALQAAVAYALLTENPQAKLPSNCERTISEPDLNLKPIHLTGLNEHAKQMKTILGNAFAFGGSNASIVFGVCND